MRAAEAARVAERVERRTARAREIVRSLGPVTLDHLERRVSRMVIRVDEAWLCEDCRTVSNAIDERCPLCDSAAVLRLSVVLDGREG